MTGNFFFYYFQYLEFVGCVCMLNGWFSSYDDICPDNYIFSRFALKGKCRSEKWEVYLCGDMTTWCPWLCGSVALGCASAWHWWCRLRFFTQLGSGSHTIYSCACLLSVAWA